MPSSWRTDIESEPSSPSLHSTAKSGLTLRFFCLRLRVGSCPDGVWTSDSSSERDVGRAVVGGSGLLAVEIGSRVESRGVVRYILSRTGSTIIFRASLTNFWSAERGDRWTGSGAPRWVW